MSGATMSEHGFAGVRRVDSEFPGATKVELLLERGVHVRFDEVINDRDIHTFYDYISIIFSDRKTSVIGQTVGGARHSAAIWRFDDSRPWYALAWTLEHAELVHK